MKTTSYRARRIPRVRRVGPVVPLRLNVVSQVVYLMTARLVSVGAMGELERVGWSCRGSCCIGRVGGADLKATLKNHCDSLRV
jgi:hypothetical protein